MPNLIRDVLLAMVAGAILGAELHRLCANRRTRGIVRRRLASSTVTPAAPTVSREAIGSLLAQAGTTGSSNLTWDGPTDSGSFPNSFSTQPRTLRWPTNSGSAMTKVSRASGDADEWPHGEWSRP